MNMYWKIAVTLTLCLAAGIFWGSLHLGGLGIALSAISGFFIGGVMSQIGD